MKWSNLIGTAALAAGMFVAAPAVANDAVSLRLNWQLVGFHAPFYYGLAKGYYRDEKIELTINEGHGGAATAQSLGAGSDTFGISDGGSVMVAVSKGVPIRTVMSIMNGGLFAVVSRKDAGIVSGKDLAGKTIAVSTGDAPTQTFPAVLKAAHLNPSDVKLVNVDPASKVITVVQKRADALLGSIDTQNFIMESMGVPAATLSYDDLGVKLVGLGVIANEITIAKNPDLIRRFVRATRRAFDDALKNPDPVIAEAIKVKPEVGAQVLKGQMLASLAQMFSQATKGKPVGVGAVEDWDRTLQVGKEYQGLVTNKTGADFFTNKFAE
jgi:NitT/TauT family transport system substrate-binding protein